VEGNPGVYDSRTAVNVQQTQKKGEERSKK
jgi:hypothetical protein